MENECFLSVKVISNDVIKRFDIPTNSTFEELKTMISKLFGNTDDTIKFMDEENDLVTIGSEDEYTEALKSVPKTGNILRIHLTRSTVGSRTTTQSNSQNSSTDSILAPDICLKKQKSSDISMDENLIDMKKKTVKHKIESASKLSKDLNFISAEVTGRIPPASEQCLNQHFTSQKPGCRKVRRLSSNTASEKNDRKAVRNRADQQRRKQNCRRSSASISSRSSCSSSSQSSSSSSESSQEESQEINMMKKKKTHVILNEMLCKSKSEIETNVLRNVEHHINAIKKEVTSEIFHSVLHQLEGAVIQSITTTPKPADQANVKCDEHEDGKTQKIRYHHQNVICDHCENEIFGPRYKCGNCSDYDLCEDCELLEGIHTPSHVFIKMHYPSPCAGRNPAGGKLRPLLRSNIYELREKEREKEDLLQRKFDANSELNHKAIEKMEKQRIKMREAERSREVREARKEEWKRMKKEIKLMRREQMKKFKKHWIAHKEMSKPTIESLPDLSCVESNPKDEETVDGTELMSPENISSLNNDTIEDDVLSTALSALKVVQKSADDFANINQEQSRDCDDTKKDSEGSLIDYDSDNTSSDVMVVKKEDISPQMQLTNKPDLVDFDQDVFDFTCNDDFVVVPKCFDLNSPLDIQHVHQYHQQHSGECTADVCFADSPDSNTDADVQTEHDSVNTMSAELPVDLVASVQTATMNQPDITPVEPHNIMDQSLEGVANESKQDILLFPLESSAEQKSEVCGLLADPTSQFSFYETQGDVVTEQSSEQLSVLPSPTLHEEILNLKRSVDSLATPLTTSETKPKTLLEMTLEKKADTDDVATRVDSVTQSQIDRELQLKRKEEEIEKMKAEEEQKATPTPFNPPSPKFLEEMNKQRQTETQEPEKDPTLSDVITGAMSSFAEVISSVVGSGRTPSAVQYQGGEDVMIRSNATTSESRPKDAMELLCDMGFFDRSLNAALVRKHKGDVNECVMELLSINQNSWHQTRH